MRLLIDTNVILDVFMRREPFFSDSYKALRIAAEKEYECLLSATAATDIYYLLRKHLKSPQQARAALHDLSHLVQFSDVQPADIDSALTAEMTDFEDAVVDAVADRVGARYILTRNTKDFVCAKTQAIAPVDFNALSLHDALST